MDAVTDRDELALASVSQGSRLLPRVQIAGWAVLILAALVETIFNRHAMQDDGVNYLDMGDSLLRRDWHMAMNGTWSPLYPLLQALALKIVKPGPYSQFTVVQAVNFLIFLFSLACFEFLLRSVRYRSETVATGVPAFSGWMFHLVGYAVFLWASLRLITIQLVSPDLLMAGILFLAVGLLLRLCERPRLSHFVCLGLALGFGYLAKAPMFLLAFLFFALAFFLVRDQQLRTKGLLLAVLIFFAISAPWALALSRAKGRVEFSDSGSFNYLTHVNQIAEDWFFQDVGFARGHYVHPVHKLFSDPPVFAFANPWPSTSALYDPSYWAEGVHPTFSFRREVWVVRHWLTLYLHSLVTSQLGLLIAFVMLFFVSRSTRSLDIFKAHWPVWLIGLAGLAMYAAVYVEMRYVAVFFALFWVGIFAGLHEHTAPSKPIAAAMTALILIAIAGPTLLSAAAHARALGRTPPHTMWQIACDLEALGVKPGDRVARLPGHFGLAWGRLLGAKEVARIPSGKATEFWCANPQARAGAIQVLSKLQVTALVVEQPPPPTCAVGREWHRIGDESHYALLLNAKVKSSQ